MTENESTIGDKIIIKTESIYFITFCVFLSTMLPVFGTCLHKLLLGTNFNFFDYLADYILAIFSITISVIAFILEIHGIVKGKKTVGTGMLLMIIMALSWIIYSSLMDREEPIKNLSSLKTDILILEDDTEYIEAWIADLKNISLSLEEDEEYINFFERLDYIFNSLNNDVTKLHEDMDFLENNESKSTTQVILLFGLFILGTIFLITNYFINCHFKIQSDEEEKTRNAKLLKIEEAIKLNATAEQQCIDINIISDIINGNGD